VIAVPEEIDNVDKRMDQFKGRSEERVGAVARKNALPPGVARPTPSRGPAARGGL
jgi:hypothetical protein